MRNELQNTTLTIQTGKIQWEESPWKISNVAQDLRSTAESKLDVLLAVWFGKKGSSGLSGLQRPHLIEQERS